MSLTGLPILSILTFLPLAGVLVIAILPGSGPGAAKRFWSIGLAVSVLEFIISIPVLIAFDSSIAGMQFTEHTPWIESLGISYSLGLDGISLWLVMLTTFFVPLCILCSFTYIQKKIREYVISFLLIETAMIGTFLAMDLVVFYVFWELMLIPMFLLIGVWGGERRIYSAVKFFLYTAMGSIFMLVAIVVLYIHNIQTTGDASFYLFNLLELHIPVEMQFWLCAAFFLAFAIKVPMFPLHTWLPDAHVEAPTAGSVILASILLKMGTYGFIRFAMPLFPYATHQFIPIIAGLGVIAIIYAALVSWVQPDIKKLVAYSSVSHMGYVLLGLFALNMQGVQGGIYQMLNHGLSTGALFLLVGMIYERRHTRLMEEFGGLAKIMPVFATFLMIATLASVAVPGTNGFVGEFLILLGAFKSYPVLAIIATSGALFSVIYMLWMYQRVMFGPVDKPQNSGLKDLTFRETAIMVPIAVLIIVMGIFPGLFLRQMDASSEKFIHTVKSRYQTYAAMEERKLPDAQQVAFFADSLPTESDIRERVSRTHGGQ
ncbi:MAG: NADH-quinone oxidoreductase subunit M [Desulfovermiculus sp.]|nr:NADH-quinone oxidoreductase subunit M [Desulfovermiculus sp.]